MDFKLRLLVDFKLRLLGLVWLAVIVPISQAHSQLRNAEEIRPQQIVHVDRGDQGMVVSDSAAASRIGRAILRNGGSAVDAAVATAFALAVAWPDAGNIGGGGFMIVRPVDGQPPVCIDYRESAPGVMHPRSFNKDDTTFSHKAVGVPGTVRGLAVAHERFGRLPWHELVMPAAQLAAAGVPIDRPLADSLNWVLAEERERSDPRFHELLRVYGRQDGKPWEVGDRMRLPDLAKSLSEIAEQGPDAFYTGRLAGLLVEEMQRGDGLISKDDLQTYQAKVRPVIRGEYRGYTVLGAPPPSSGGICVVEALNILENFDLASRDRYDPITIHLIAEAMRRAFADRARYLGDPDFGPIPLHLIDKSYAKVLASQIDPDAATPSASVTPEISLVDESPDTTHFSVVDADGMAVSNTYTLEASWGSRIVVQGAGFVLNNEMGDFNWFPGETNRLGRIGTAANTVAGGKRMLSSQSPTILEKDGQLVLVTGSPGGRTIINTVLCILLDVIDFQRNPAEAVANVRMHHQWFPDRIDLEAMANPPHARAVETLRSMGHALQGRSVQGSAHTIAIDRPSNQMLGVADYRRGGRPAAVKSKRVALWDFAEPTATPMTKISCFGDEELHWSSSIPGFTTDGQDHLRIHAGGEGMTRTTQIGLPRSARTWSVEIKIDSARFTGLEKNEQLDFALTSGADPEQLIAKLEIGRRGSDGVSMRGQTVQETMEPISISDRNELDRPVILKLSLDPSQRRFQIASRYADTTRFTLHGELAVAGNPHADHFQLGVRNNLADDGEYVNVDRIEVLTSVLGEALP